MRRGSQASSRKQAGDKATEASPETSKQLMPPPPAKVRRGDAVEGGGGASSAVASSSTGASTLSEMPFLALNGLYALAESDQLRWSEARVGQFVIAPRMKGNVQLLSSSDDQD